MAGFASGFKSMTDALGKQSEDTDATLARGRKKAAYDALHKVYGDVAGDPEAAQQLQATAQGAEAFPLIQQGRQQAIDLSAAKMREDQATTDEKQRQTRSGAVVSSALFIKNALERDPNADVGALYDRVSPILGLDPQTNAQTRAALVADPKSAGDIVTAFRLKQAAGAGDPSAVREYQYFSTLPPAEQTNYLRVKRANATPEIAGQIAGAQTEARQAVNLNYAQPIAEAQGTGRALGKVKGEAEGQSVHGVEDIAKAQATANNNELRFDAAETNLKQASDWSDKAGMLATASQFVPNSAGSNFVSALNSVHSDIVNNVIQNYKETTPQGQASGVGRILASEIKLWQDAYAAVNLRQSPSVRKENIRRLTEVTKALRQTSQEYFKSVYGIEGKAGGDKASAPAAGGQGSRTEGDNVILKWNPAKGDFE